ncbi:MAG TPA: polysaccharide biosynthesis/export family protein [Longimicrobium sp.]|nr:polysaccharide biosynthesis/export family protein [Longimicrobium sp.]
MHPTVLKACAAAASICVAATAPARAQQALAPQSTRAELEALAQRLGDADPAAAAIRQRLRDGDFQPGDQVSLTVDGETALTGTFTVGPGRLIPLPQAGDLALAGVLRSELEAAARAHVARYLRDPVVHARALVRIGVLGQVGKPGYYVLPAESLLSDVLMAAGGPLPTARLDAATVNRVSTRMWNGAQVHQALAAGLTLDQLGIRPGDELVVPQRGGGRGAAVLRVLTAVPAAALAITGFGKL